MRVEPRLPPEQANVSPGSPLVELLQLVIGGVVVLLVVVFVAGLVVDRAVGWIPRSWEQQAFGPLVRQLVESSALEGDELERVQTELDRLAPAFPVELGLVEDSQINAFALPGGGILLTRGLLDVASDDELRFVLAHELAHLERRDGLRALGRGVAVAVVLSLVGVGGNTSPLELGEVTGKLALRGFGRDQEREADRLAITRVLAQGLDPSGGVALLERFQAKEGAGARAVAWARTHPLSDERIEAIRALAAAADTVDRSARPR